MKKPIVIQVDSELCQAGNLVVYGEGKGMCMEGVVHISQRGFGGHEQIITFRIDQIGELVRAFCDLPMMTENNSKKFTEKIYEELAK